MRKMIRKTFRKGFTLLEMTIVLIIITILTSAAIPALTQNFVNQAEQKTSMDINNIQNAALAYYVHNSAWPTSITPTGVNPPTDLESNGFLPTGWNATNPFGNAYSIANSGSILTVSTQVASGTQTTILNQLPTSSYSGNVVSSSVPVPGVTSSGFGQWQSINFDQPYQAPSDGYVVGSVYLRGGISGTQSAQADYYTSSTNPPTSNPSAHIPIYLYQAPGQTNGAIMPFNFPVRKGDYYEMVLTQGYVYAENLYYLPS
jgi:prepilin-type N-terminal cleavage/methylation domain-containing protein